VKAARQRGYRSRAAFKLLEVDDRDRLLAHGSVVVDLGAAPGGWSQVAAERVGDAGQVIALDLLPLAPLAGVQVLQGDFREERALEALESALGGRAVDVVLSDMSPNLSGVKVADQARSMYLAELALEFARRHLVRGGCLLVKVFHGAGLEALRREMRDSFSRLEVRKPDASRSRSAETYLLGRGFDV
jgi:23S rRNA (uridine2552-2'-O)-methyltransferase